MALKFVCSECGAEIIVKHLKPGEPAQCKKCGAENIVPEDASVTEQQPVYESSRKLFDDSIKKEKKAIPQDIGGSVPLARTTALPRKPYPGILQSIGIIIIYLLVCLGLGFQVGMLSIALNHPLHESDIVLAIVALLGWVIILVIGYFQAKKPFKEIYPFVRHEWLPLVLVLLILLGARLFMLGFTSLSIKLLLGPEIGSALAKGVLSAYKLGFWLSLLFIVILGPIIEECVFRGLMLQGLLQRYSVKKAVIASAVLFGLVHVNPLLIIWGFILGLLLGWLFVLTRSLLPCVLVHALGNLTALSSYYLFVQGKEAPGAVGHEGILIETILIILGLATCIVGIDVLSRKIRALPQNR